jgi:hypothetical protein
MTAGDDEELAEQITASQSRDSIVQTTLQTDGRVLARVTDGIYRQPGSAIRELISNAYDADATRVIITTDRPRFGLITVEDDGVGMSAEAIVHLLHHIGGSAKRSVEGVSLGVTSASDPLRSPGGRRLIGKIGIGLFSIAQLTQTFQIITKTKGDVWRTIAAVALSTYTDEQLADSGGTYEAGLVSIWQEPASDTAAHGTTIVLDNIRPTTRETLQSAGDWIRVESDEAEPPRYHIGRFSATNDDHELRSLGFGMFNSLPWSEDDEPRKAFRNLVNAVWRELDKGDRNPKLEQVFDYYLQMVWELSLAVPVPYVKGNPFDIRFGDSAYLYELPGTLPKAARAVELSGSQTLRQVLKLDDTHSEGDGFRILLDDLELQRPLVFTGLPATTNKVKKPLLFVGYLREEFIGIDRAISGGPLELTAYLLWTPKIAPVDHAGVLIRIHGASGTLFDSSFMRYQVAEPTRLRQISCEVFVTAGLDAAINIDRESFNYAHPHVVRLTSWLHTALSRVINQQKLVSSFARRQSQAEGEESEQSVLEAIVSNAWEQVAGDDDDIPPVLLPMAPSDSDRNPGSYVFDRAKVLGDAAWSTSLSTRRVERQTIAITQVLAAFELLDVLDPDQREDLIRFIADILKAGS